MKSFKPSKRRDFIRKLYMLGFDGPYSGSRHQFLIYANHRLTVPSNDEYSIPQVKMMLKEVESILGRNISALDWNKL